MPQVNEPALSWSLTFHGPVLRGNGKETVDMYSLRHRDVERKGILIAVTKGDQETPKLVEAAMNGLGVASYQPHRHWFDVFKRIFHGPWTYDELLRKRWIRITEDEERQLRQIMFKESAEREMALHDVEVLQQDLSAAKKRVELLEQALLRANASRQSHYVEHLTEAIKEQGDIFADPHDEDLQELFVDFSSANLGNRPVCGG